jgi:hypothetical protein
MGLPKKKKNQIVPALGNTWSHCVTTRILLHSTQEVRKLVIAKSPSSPMVEMAYLVVKAGVAQGEEATLPISGADAGHFSSIDMGGAYDHKVSGPEA